MLYLMEWIGQAHDRLRAALNPELTDDLAARAELRSAKVPEHRIDALYPLDHFSHVDSVSRLLYDHELISLMQAPLLGLNVEKLSTYSPQKINLEATQALHTIYTVSGQQWHFLIRNGIQSKKIIIGELAQDAALRNVIAKGLLSLPLALNAFSRYPFESQGWSYFERVAFDKHAAPAEEEMEKVLNLIRIYKPKFCFD